MKKIFATLMLCVMTIAASAQVKSVDIKGDLRSDFGLGLGVTADLINNVEIAPSFNYFFVDGDVTSFSVEADFHYNFNVANALTVYPIAGVVYNYAKVKGFDGDGKFGVNLGAGAKYNVTSNLAAFVEGKYQWVDGGDDTYFSLGVKIGI